MKRNTTINAIGGKPKKGKLHHSAALLLAALMFIYLIYQLQPLFYEFYHDRNWGAFSYLFFASIIIPAYWPYSFYRLILLLTCLVSNKREDYKTFSIIEEEKLPLVSIIVATRNEPKEIVIKLLESLTNIDYPNYEIVLSDNSDLVISDNETNWDLVEIFRFAESNDIRVIRRDYGPVEKINFSLPLNLRNKGVKGNVIGGKAANLNAAIDSAEHQFDWFFILDSDSSLSSSSLREMISIGEPSKSLNRPVGFVQSTLSSSNPKESTLSNSQSILDQIYFDNYYKSKASIGVTSNWGHGLLVSRVAWQATKGFPLEISEDLAWANELLLLDSFDNYYAFCSTSEIKPATWNAYKIQRNRWAKGTTIQLRKQLLKIWRSKQLLWQEKMDITYDMSSYLFIALGCLIPFFFLFSGVLGYGNRMFFKTLIPFFYIVMALDNLLVPVESIRIALNGNTKKAYEQLKAVPYISIYGGGIASQIFIAVSSAFISKKGNFQITPKKDNKEKKTIVKFLIENKISYLLFLVNGWITLVAWNFNPAIVPVLILSPISYFFAPILGTRWKQTS